MKQIKRGVHQHFGVTSSLDHNIIIIYEIIKRRIEHTRFLFVIFDNDDDNLSKWKKMIITIYYGHLECPVEFQQKHFLKDKQREKDGWKH